jgi:hypothetical protein
VTRVCTYLINCIIACVVARCFLVAIVDHAYAQVNDGLKTGEYACYGSGGSILVGLGFKVLGGERYTDLDGKSAGTYTVTTGSVRFAGGHLDGQNARNLGNGRFVLGLGATCEPFR